MSKGQPNASWREQRKAVVMKSEVTGHESEFISVWQASHMVAELFACKPETAKKEIKKAIKTGAKRYGALWHWK